MKLSTGNKDFEPCPEYSGSAVCVDVTPLKAVETSFGLKEKFRFVFEIPVKREDGSNFCVWSQSFTPSFHERAALRPFLKKWLGYELSGAELDSFDTEMMMGKTANITVIHETKGNETFANIGLIQPDKSANPEQPCGKFVRAKDRSPKDQAGKPVNPAPATPPTPPARSDEPQQVDHGAVRIHVGKCTGQMLRDLSEEQVGALIKHWLPMVASSATVSPDDAKLKAALEWFKARQEKAADDLAF